MTHGGSSHPEVVARLEQIAAERKMKVQHEAVSASSGTDTDVIFWTRGGIPSALVSLPNRYMHSPVELISLKDLEQIPVQDFGLRDPVAIRHGAIPGANPAGRVQSDDTVGDALDDIPCIIALLGQALARHVQPFGQDVEFLGQPGDLVPTRHDHILGDLSSIRFTYGRGAEEYESWDAAKVKALPDWIRVYITQKGQEPLVWFIHLHVSDYQQ